MHKLRLFRATAVCTGLRQVRGERWETEESPGQLPGLSYVGPSGWGPPLGWTGWKRQGEPCCWFDNKKLYCFVIGKIIAQGKKFPDRKCKQSEHPLTFYHPARSIVNIWRHGHFPTLLVEM